MTPADKVRGVDAHVRRQHGSLRVVVIGTHWVILAKVLSAADHALCRRRCLEAATSRHDAAGLADELAVTLAKHVLGFAQQLRNIWLAALPLPGDLLLLGAFLTRNQAYRSQPS